MLAGVPWVERPKSSGCSMRTRTVVPEHFRAEKAAAAHRMVKCTKMFPALAFARILSRACGRPQGFFLSRQGGGPPGRKSARVQLEHGGVRMVMSNSPSLIRASQRACASLSMRSCAAPPLRMSTSWTTKPTFLALAMTRSSSPTEDLRLAPEKK